MPRVTVSAELAMIRMAEMIGPRQGVHPKAKAKPTTNAPSGDFPPFTECSRLSAYSALIFIMPVKCRPKIMITAPATQVRYFLYSLTSCPTLVAAAPSITNTRVKPRTNMSECSSTVFNSLRSLFWSSSTLAPEINETYPGTSGNTHGDKNETIPARNAVIGKGNEDIGLSQPIQTKNVLHCNLVTDFPIENRAKALRPATWGARKSACRLSNFQPSRGASVSLAPITNY